MKFIITNNKLKIQHLTLSKIMKKSFLLLFSFAILIQGYAQIAQWRGDARDGKYNETGLLKQWTEGEPKLLWHYDELGPGHASAAVTDERIYTAGTTAEGNGFIIALDHSGKEIWTQEYGKEWVEDWDGVRSTPLVYNDKVYMLSAYGNLVCLKANNGELVWQINIFSDYDGKNIQWGVTENLLIDDNKLFVTVGGTDANIIALNKDDGKLIWKSKGNGEKSAYCSPAIIEHADKKLVITHTENSILGIEASSGTLLWSYNFPNKYSVHPNTPVYKDGFLYCLSGYGKGGVMLKLSDDGNSVTEVWTDELLDNKMGGVIVLNDRIYGSGDANKKWFCIDWKTGELLFLSKEIKVGNVIYADGLLYCYGQDGKISLVKPEENAFNVISTFTVPYGEKQHWAHLIIHDKKLYVRHGTSLMVYDIAAEK